MKAKTPTLEQFKAFARSNAPAARAVLAARVFAKIERARVDAYVRPIFDARTFEVAEKWRTVAGTPERITDPRDLYLCADDAACAEFFEACDAAHRAHGFTGPKGHCPALMAENRIIELERDLIDRAADLFGIASSDVWGADRKKYIELLIGACVKAGR
jgi:hypothetical protein